MLRFKRKSLLCFVVLFSLSTTLSLGQAKTNSSFETNPTFRAGGLPFYLPAPNKSLTEAGPDYRVVLEPLAPESNRLIAAFVAADVLPVLRTGNLPSLRDYALVEIPRRAEFVDVDADSFKQLAGSLGKQFGADLTGNLNELQQELDLRLKALGGSSSVTLDKPLPLGLFFFQAGCVRLWNGNARNDQRCHRAGGNGPIRNSRSQPDSLCVFLYALPGPKYRGAVANDRRAMGGCDSECK